jgi:hypothetical protein
VIFGVSALVSAPTGRSCRCLIVGMLITVAPIGALWKSDISTQSQFQLEGGTAHSRNVSLRRDGANQ